MKKIILLLSVSLCVSLLFAGCSKKKTDQPGGDITPAPTAVPENQTTPEPTPTAAPIPDPPEPFDADGRAVAAYGTPIVDGTIDDAWKGAAIMIPDIVSSGNVQAEGEFRVLWDDNALYTLFIVTDPVLNKASANTYEQDSVEVFLDELNDKASAYQNDDVHYRVNYENMPSTDAGDLNRFYTATSELKDNSGNVIGYIVETSLAWAAAPANQMVFGFELQINDAGADGRRAGTVNLFDATGSAWSNPSRMGELILVGRSDDAAAAPNPYMLLSYVKYAENFNASDYVNGVDLLDQISKAKAVLDKKGSSQEELDNSLNRLKDAVAKLDDGSGFMNAEKLTSSNQLTDPFTFFDGTKLASKADWDKRAEEISNLYQYYMYGVMPEGEKVTYSVNGKTMNIQVEANGKKVTYPVQVNLPDSSKVKAPAGGYPVIFAFGWLQQIPYANEHGYAVITLDTSLIAADNTSRTGVFYDLYPYGTAWKDQTGTLVAWSWGISKIIDALEVGAGAELNISAENTILTGVSRWGKAAAVGGAFEKRIKVTAPSCSGAGGMAAFRYVSEGKTYDYTGIGVSAPYTMTANEPLGSLQSSAERQWFNDKFLQFSDVNQLPFDQHLLAALTAEENRYLFITGSYLYEDWTNPPAMWLTYLAAREIFDYLGYGDNIAIHIHKEGHAVTDQDMVYLIDFCDYHFYGKSVKSNLQDLTTTLFAEPANHDPIFDRYTIQP